MLLVAWAKKKPPFLPPSMLLLLLLLKSSLCSSLVLNSLRSSLRVPFVLHPDPLPLDPNSARFRAVVLHQLAEPRVLERLPGGDALLGIVDEDFPEKVQEQLVKLRGGRDDLFKSLHGPDEFARLSRGVGEGVSEVLVLEKARGTVTVASLALLHDLADEGLIDWVARDSLMRLLADTIG